MNRGLTVTSGLILTAILVSTAWGQASTERRSLADRMSALRRGFTGEPQRPQKREVLPTPEAADGTQVPNWLGGGDVQQPKSQSQQSRFSNQQQQQTGRRVTQKTPTQSGQGATTQQGTTNKRQSNSSTAQSAQGFSLPGLGGSRLPAGGRPSPRKGVDGHTSTPSTAAQDPNYPVIRDVTPGDQSTGNGTAATPRRTSPQFRSEFSGTNSSRAQDAPTARTAQREARESDEPAEAQSEPMAISAEPETPTLEATPSLETTPSDEPANAAEAFGEPSQRRSGFGGEFIRTPRSNALPQVPSAARSKEAFGEALQVASGGDPTVLVSNQTPLISTDIRGPKQILVGREAVYRVRLQNQGTAAAESVVATIRIPSSAEIVDTTATNGTVQPSPNGGGVEWHLPRLDGRGSEVVDVRLIPRESRPLELGVTWTQAPVGSRTVVEVQEPLLKIEIGGPTEVLFDQPQVFRLTLSNPGTGPADNVRIDLVPPGGNADSATSHQVGSLAPGDSRTIEIELTAREAGKLMMKAVASAEGGLVSDSSKEIFCRKPELEVDWRGPATKYANTPATYFFRVRNPGTAPAEDVSVRVTLPDGVEFTSASEGSEFDSDRAQVTWRVGTLNPGDDNYMELKCVMNAPGANQLTFTAATAEGSLSDSGVAETRVEALADLKLSVTDPSGPVAVGTQAMYEIRVVNRGADSARNVNVVALFSDGIEPDQADGAMYTVTDGRVSFQPIEEIPAGGGVTLRIRARALQAGTHVFRAEVLCSELEIKLAAEETTRFYSDEVVPDSEEPSEQSAGRYGFEPATR
jgi:uncharacterized repeat protein (TIGR01451 family)